MCTVIGSNQVPPGSEALTTEHYFTRVTVSDTLGFSHLVEVHGKTSVQPKYRPGSAEFFSVTYVEALTFDVEI